MKWIVIWLCLLMPLMPLRAEEGSWIGWCKGPDNAARAVPLFTLQGGQSWLTMGTGPIRPGCRGHGLAVALGHVQWFGALPASQDWIGGIALYGSQGANGFAVADVQLQEEAVTAPLPVAVKAAPARRMLPRTLARSAWIWQPDQWRDHPGQVLDRLARMQVRMVYVTVPTGNGVVVQPDLLGDFIALAAAQGVEVWAVMGDPHAVLPSERGRFVDMAHLYARYNSANPPGRRLAGLQLDIEPYLLPGYAQAPVAWDAALVKTLNRIAAAAEMNVEVALPVWFGSPARFERVLDRLSPQIQTFAIMDYRTDQRRIVEGAVPFLAWAGRSGKGVRIAVETGPLPDQDIRFYDPATSGELWRLPLADGDALILLDHAVAGLDGGAFGLVRTSLAAGHALSFHGGNGQIADILHSLESELMVWPSFRGMAVHGME